jgi:hypothetical protein
MRATTGVSSVLLLALALPLPVLAALGSSEGSIQLDQSQMQASRRILTATRYTLHEIQLPSGTTVREYVSAGGTVFGVAWQGPFMPDLRQLLGSYFPQYVDAASLKQGQRGPMTVIQPGLVVRSGGHMRAFSGQAYLPALLPQGVSVEEIR